MVEENEFTRVLVDVNCDNSRLHTKPAMVTTVLIGNLTFDDEGSIKGNLANMPYTTVMTIEISIQADGARADDLLRQMDLKALQALVQ